jgi:hypothetical protein
LNEVSKKVALGIVLAVLIAVGAGYVALTFFPSHPSGSLGPLVPLEVQLGARQVHCSLTNGTCSMIVYNNSNTSMTLDWCWMTIIISSNGESQTYSAFNGTAGGHAALSGIPANSNVPASCTISPSLLTHQTNGSIAGGSFAVALSQQWRSFPPGTIAAFAFQGTWT